MKLTQFHAHRKRDLRKAVYLLSKHPLVKSVAYHHNRINIIYKSGIKERWYHKSRLSGRIIIPDYLFEGDYCRIKQEYRTFPGDSEIEEKNNSFILRYKDYKVANIFSKRIITHELIDKFISTPVKNYPCELLLDDLNKITCKPRKILNVFSRSNSGKLLYDHFTNYKEVDKISKILYYAIKRLLKSKRDVTNRAIINKIRETVFIRPGVYLDLFEMLKIKNLRIADPYPTISKAVAISINNSKYHSNFKNKPLEEFLGTTFYDLEDVVYDVLLLDGNFREEVVSDIKAKHVIRFSMVERKCLRSIKVNFIGYSGYILVEKNDAF